MSHQPHDGNQRAEASAADGDAELLARFERHLVQRRHSPSTARTYRRAAAHFLRWRRRKDAAAHSRISPEAVQQFLVEHLPVCTCPPPIIRSPRSVRAALNQVLLMTGGARLTHEQPSASAAIEAAVGAFDRHLLDVCGLAEQTRRSRCRCIQEFLGAVFPNGPILVEHITAATLIDFITASTTRERPHAAAMMVCALRSYLRFLRVDGRLQDDIGSSIPAPALWPLAALPPALADSDLALFWTVFDRSTPVGRRDYAMARCLADLALRCHEVAALTLEAIDWRAGVLTLTGTKSRRCDRLPLPEATGAALAEYLRLGRPACDTRAVFVHHRAPVGAAVARTTVRGVVRRAFARAGLPWTGTHILRHTAARRMLQRGCPLKEIADVLRHRSLDTTAIYAKVDLPQLRQVALPWPEVRS